MIKLLLSILLIYISQRTVIVFAVDNPCTNGDIITGIAINCAAPELVNLIQAPTTEEKCGIVLNTIQPCIITAVYNTYNVTCTAKEKHDLILTFKDAIKTYIKFDISVCIPQPSCSNFDAFIYYLPIYCDSDYDLFVDTDSCSKFLDMLTCYTETITTNETCTSKDIYDSIMMNLEKWPHTICPACKPLSGYFCGRGPNRQNCPAEYYCNIHPADGFAVCCPNDPDLTTASTTVTGTSSITTLGDTSSSTSLTFHFTLYLLSPLICFVC